MEKNKVNLMHLDFDGSYNSDEDDFIKDVYKPCYENSIQYDRLVGYFKASVFSLNYSAIEKFVKNGGKMRFITSHDISLEEFDTALKAKENSVPITAEERIKLKIKDILEQEDNDKRHLKMFSYFINKEIIDWKINIVPGGSEHHKKGLFYDSYGNIVLTSGGVNETYSGIKIRNDSIDIDCSWWDGAKHEGKIRKQVDYFEKLWNNEAKKTICLSLSKDLRNAISEAKFSDEDYKKEIKKINEEEIKKLAQQDKLKEVEKSYTNKKVEGKESFKSYLQTRKKEMFNTLKPHQKEAVQLWEEKGKTALLEYCTGSGKTYIAIYTIILMLLEGRLPIVIVPSTALLKQWGKELRTLIKKIILIQTSDPRWDVNLKTALEDIAVCDRKDINEIVVLATVQTARLARFKDIIKPGENKFLIVDECHCLWAGGCNTIIQENIPWGESPRLGLSATPDDMTFSDDIKEDDEDDENDIESELDEFDRKKTKTWKQNVFEFFGCKKENEIWISSAKYELSNAIEDGVLIPYYYNISYIILTQEELDEYKDISKKMGQCFNKSSKDNDYFQFLVFKRRALINGAENKLKEMIDILKSNQESISEQHWLLYCSKGLFKDTGESVIDTVQNEVKRYNFSSHHYKFTEDTRNRDRMIQEYETTGGFLYAIDMMDEGVDITHLNHGMILSTSRNKRQFIQRRGRLLRREKGQRINKHNKAYIYDIIVLPVPMDDIPEKDIAEVFKKHVSQEIDRVQMFAKDSLNADENLITINSLRNKYDFDES